MRTNKAALAAATEHVTGRQRQGWPMEASPNSSSMCVETEVNAVCMYPVSEHSDCVGGYLDLGYFGDYCLTGDTGRCIFVIWPLFKIF